MPHQVPNARRDFWIIDGTSGERRQITARLRLQAPHVAMWVEDGVWHDVRRLAKAAEHFEGDIYMRARAALGSEWVPGIDNNPRIHILHATGLGEGVQGYTSSLDEYPSEAFPQSNMAEMITVNLETVEIGTPSYNALLARELAQLIQWNLDRNEAPWVEAGLSELAAALTGSDTERLSQAYLRQTDVPLTAWKDSEVQRGAALLLATYFHEQFGDQGTRALADESANGIRGFERALEKLGTGLTFDRVLADWLATTYLDHVSRTSGSEHAYQTIDLDRPTPSVVYDTYPVEMEAKANQLGADVIVLRGHEDLRVRFSGRRETPLLGRMPDIEDREWWSNRADESVTTLTRRLDLTTVERATLTYRAWFDIEPRYDYVTVETSTDGGEEWRVLTAPSGAAANPYGRSEVWGYTGRSDGWIREEIDLSEVTGGEVLVRFRYVTDGAITGEGLLLDDVVLTADDGSAREIREDDWEVGGFVRTDGRVLQDYVLLLIGVGPEISVTRLQLEEDRSGEWVVPLASGGLEEAVLIVSAVAPATHQPASYMLTVSAD